MENYYILIIIMYDIKATTSRHNTPLGVFIIAGNILVFVVNDFFVQFVKVEYWAIATS